jgi:hypothetical protein
LHQHISAMGQSYKSTWSAAMLADYCWWWKEMLQTLNASERQKGDVIKIGMFVGVS